MITKGLRVEILQTMTAEAVLTPIPALEGEQLKWARKLLEASALPRYTRAEKMAYRDQWGPWLRGHASAPVMPKADLVV